MNEHDPMQREELDRQREFKDTQGKRAKDTEKGDLRWLMKQKRGRRMMMRMLELSGVYRTSFSENALTMAFNEGNRNPGLYWLNQIHQHCSEQYTAMLQEQADERARDVD